MNARIDPMLTLEEVAKHVEQWRSHKKQGERIPQGLWNEALGLVGDYGISQVSRSLRLSYTQLNKRLRIIEGEQRQQAPSAQTAFVEIEGEFGGIVVPGVPREGAGSGSGPSSA